MDQALYDEFISDFKALLGSIEKGVEEVEKSGRAEPEAVEDMFRAFHSIKGGSAVIGLDNLHALSTLLENLTGKVRDGEMALDASFVNGLKSGAQVVKAMVEDPERSRRMDISELSARLKSILEGRPVEEVEKAQAEPEKTEAERGGASGFDFSGVDLTEAARKYDCLYELVFELSDFAKSGRSLEDVVETLSKSGKVLDSRFDARAKRMAVEKPESMPFRVLYATILEPEYIGELTGLAPDRITRLEMPEPKETPAAADVSEDEPSREPVSVRQPPAPDKERTELPKGPFKGLSQETYGQIMLHAREIERIAQDLDSVDRIQTSEEKEIFQKLRGLTKDMMEKVKLKSEADGFETGKRIEGAQEKPAEEQADRAEFVPETEPDSKLVFMLEYDRYLSGQLREQISNYGYEVRAFFSPEEMIADLDKARPMALIMDVQSPENGDGFKHAEKVRAKVGKRTPLIFISDEDNLKLRIESVRVGGRAFYSRPVDINALIEKLDVLTEVSFPEPYRILIVDDQASIAKYHESILKEFGMMTKVVTDPFKVIEAANDFTPDLILMDIYMPGCTGVEIANVLRQKEEFVSIPIVYLSSESDVGRQLYAMSIGGDDFLTKPIKPDHLISSVGSRAERYRTLRSFMERDSMTGLLNHTNITERLSAEVARAGRHDEIFAFAMLDIDKFKQVNDKYGHPVGDRVIKSLARLLRQRLRNTDIIGRYGGEEFSVILLNTEGASAAKVMNEIRQAFSQIVHQHGDETFYVTFSCGITTYPECQDANRLIFEADMALYEAKKAGRNCVVQGSCR